MTHFTRVVVQEQDIKSTLYSYLFVLSLVWAIVLPVLGQTIVPSSNCLVDM